MIWHLVEHNEDTGRFNMDFDLELADLCTDDKSFFRLYKWKPYCISLGANQDFSDINSDKAGEAGIDVVKRPTGGRAILHAEEVTYSVVVPTSIGYSPKELYHKISRGLLTGLTQYDERLSKLKLENEQPHFPSLLKQSSGKLCFASTARNEIKFEGRKVVGSAQRKMNNVLLQHGSILCGNFHRKLPEFINDPERLSLEESTVELETILNEKINYPRLYQCLISGMQSEWETEFKEFTPERGIVFSEDIL